MENIFSFACAHSHDAYWVLFLLLLLAGVNIPVSEDLILLLGGALASSCLPPMETYNLYAWLFFGCWFSAWEAYWLGRIWGPKLYTTPWIKHWISPQRVGRLHTYCDRFGVFTFIFGRFIPGGVRNAIFVTCGLGGMPFLQFILRDSIGCLIASATIFYIGYSVGENYAVIAEMFHRYELYFIGFLVSLLVCFIFIRRKK